MTIDMNHLPHCGCQNECQSVSFTICRDGRGRMPETKKAPAIPEGTAGEGRGKSIVIQPADTRAG